MSAQSFASGAEPFEPGYVFGTELLLEFPAKALSERGAFAVSGDGDLEIATLDDGAVIEMAVIDVVNGVAEDVASVGFGKDLSVEITDGCSSDDEEYAGEIFGMEGLGRPIKLAITEKFGEGRVEFRRNDAECGAGFEKTGYFLRGNGATANDEDAAVGEFQEGRKEAHGRISMMWISSCGLPYERRGRKSE